MEEGSMGRLDCFRVAGIGLDRYRIELLLPIFPATNVGAAYPRLSPGARAHRFAPQPWRARPLSVSRSANSMTWTLPLLVRMGAMPESPSTFGLNNTRLYHSSGISNFCPRPAPPHFFLTLLTRRG